MPSRSVCCAEYVRRYADPNAGARSSKASEDGSDKMDQDGQRQQRGGGQGDGDDDEEDDDSEGGFLSSSEEEMDE